MSLQTQPGGAARADPQDSRSDQPADQTIKPAGVIGLIAYLVLMPGALFLAAGSLDWFAGWVYVLMLLAVTIGSRIIVLRKHPGLLLERSRFMEGRGVAKWDRMIVPYIGGIGPLLLHLVAGLNYRFGWLPFLEIWVQAMGLIAVGTGFLLASWAMLVNPFFSAVVRIQTDRGHSVIAAGPYAWIRHPAYAGGILSTFATPLLLGTIWALIPALSVCLLLIVRTQLEDKFLLDELAGYADFAADSRSRLIPGVW